MKFKVLQESAPKTWAVVFETGDEVASGLKQFASDHQLSAARFSAIGAFSEVLLGYFNLEKRDYKRIPVREQVEVLSLNGDITLNGNERNVHAHVVVGKSDGTAHGGHLIEARVRPTLEVTLVESPSHLRRSKDPATGLALIDIE